MSKVATWSIILGFFLLALGFILRTILMMRSSDSTPPHGRVLHGRDLQRQFRVRFPNSAMPLMARSALLVGLLLLFAGVATVLSH